MPVVLRINQILQVDTHTMVLKALGLVLVVVREARCGGLAALQTRHRQRFAHSTSEVVAALYLSILKGLLVAKCPNPRCAFRTARLTSGEVDAETRSRSLWGISISLQS